MIESNRRLSQREKWLICRVTTPVVLLVLLVAPIVFAGAEEFRLIQVAVRVVDPQGKPVPNAQTQIYSEDWHTRFPRNQSDGLTDSQGRCAFTVPVGQYTFFAGSPLAYGDSHPGQGLYLVRGPLKINESCEILLKPDSIIRVAVTGSDGSPLPVARLRVSESSHCPWLDQPEVGLLRNGRIDLTTNSQRQFHLVVHTLHEQGRITYLLGKANVPSGHPVSLRGDVPGLARLHVEVLDCDNHRVNAGLRFDVPELCWGRLYAAHAINGTRDYVFTPMLLGLSYERRDERGWCVSIPRYFHLQAGQHRTIRFGGPITITPQISDTFGHTEFLFAPLDATGNHIACALDPQGKRRYTLTVQKEGKTVFSGPLAFHNAPLALSAFIDEVKPSGDLEYVAALDLCPLGKHEVRGCLTPNLQWQKTPAGPFTVCTPTGFPNKTTMLASLVERIARAQASIMGAKPTEEGFPAYVKVNAALPRPGTPSALSAMSLDSFLALDPGPLKSNCEGVLPHEIGHIMQGSGDKSSPGWYVGPANEAQANLLAFAAKSSLYSMRAAWIDAGEILNVRFVESWTAGDKIPPVFGYNLPNFYLIKKHGWEPHRRNNEISWLRKGNYEQLLGMVGLTKPEAMVAVLSYLCDRDLCWLYRLADFPVRDRHVQAAIQLLSKNRLSFGYPTDRVILCDTSLSLPLHLANNTTRPLAIELDIEPKVDGREQGSLELAPGSEADHVVDMPRNVKGRADLTITALATPDLSNTLKVTTCPVRPTPLTSGTVTDSLPSLLQTRSGLLLAWKRGDDVAVGRLEEGQLGSVQIVSQHSSYPRLLELNDGTLWLVYNASRNNMGNIFFQSSTDDGATWSNETQITFVKPYVTTGAAVSQDADGSIWLGYNNRITISRDMGRTWTPIPQIPEMGYGWFNLVSVPPLGMLCMVGWSSLDVSVSGDAGTTWGGFRTIDAYPRFSDNHRTSFPHLVRGKSGRLHLTYNSDIDGRSLWYRSSADNGETWGDFVRVVADENLEEGASVEEVGGSVWIVWAKREDSNSHLMLSVLSQTVLR